MNKLKRICNGVLAIVVNSEVFKALNTIVTIIVASLTVVGIALVIGMGIVLLVPPHSHDTEDSEHQLECRLLALELERDKTAWEDIPKGVGHNLKSVESEAYFKAYNLFNITCTDVH
jgi:hypothetical protein